MKLALMICVIIASLCSVHGFLDPVEIPIRVKGTLTCSTPFRYKLNLEEQDNVVPTDIQVTEWVFSNKKTANYEVSEKAYDMWPENYVEPMLVIHHTCGGNYGCVCKDFGAVGEDLEAKVNVNFESTDLKGCSRCMGGIMYPVI
ncbi:hypothetical protein PENTCL1PPCAC_3101, partial [Pristionchus entomophagus]